MIGSLTRNGKFGWSMARGVRARGVPYQIADLAADFDADDLLASLSDTDPVTTWADATGNANDVGNTGSNRPTFDAVNPQFNGHASVNFAKASTQYLFGSSLPLSTALSGTDVLWTAFVVYRRSTKVTAQETFLSLGKSDSAVNYQQARWVYANSNSQRPGASLRDGAGAADSGFQGIDDIVSLGPQIAVVTRGSSAMTHHVIGGSQNPRYDATVDTITATTGDAYGTQGAFTHNRFAIGALVRSTVSSPCDMEVARVLVYTRELSDAERSTVSEYLWDRYCRRYGTTAETNGLIHVWAATSATQNEGETCPFILDPVGGESIDAPLSANRPTVRRHANGERYLEFDGVNDALRADTAADWAFLHDGSDWTMFITYRVPSDATTLVPLVDTCDNDTVNNNGIGVYHDAASAAHSLQVKVGATNATAVLNHDSQDYGSRPDAWHVAAITHEGTIPSTEENYHVALDNEFYFAGDQGVTPAAGAPPYAITVGSLGGLGTSGKFDFAELRIYNRKLGTPGEVQAVAEILGRYYNGSHCALVGGNGLPNTLNDSASHRGFPALCQDANGLWHCVYRRGATHGSSRGVGVHCTSADGIIWSAEQVIYDVDDDDGRDWRGGCGFICLQHGPHAGRLLLSTNWAADDSSLEVPGFASTNMIGYSDDNGSSWTWINPQENDPKNVYEDPWDYTVANAGALIELSTGRILMTFTSKDAANGTTDQDLNLSYSDDGGLTWSDSVIIGEHDVCFNGQANKRVTECWIVEADDGTLEAYVRNDTDEEIWRATADISDVENWTFATAKLFDGYGRPTVIVDPNDADGRYIFHRDDVTLLTVWRYSSDRGVNWSAARAFSNLHATTGTRDGSYPYMSYTYPTLDSNGSIWVAYGLEDQTTDSDIFVRRWADAEA